MFCPEGYVSLAELWATYREARLRDIYEHSARYYQSNDFIALFVRGSPLDICEYVFLTSVGRCGLHLASPEGALVRVFVPEDESRASLCSVRAAGPSVDCWMAMEIEAENDPAGMTRDAYKFQPWNGDAQDETPWTEAYPILPEGDDKAWLDAAKRLRFHCLPLCLERPVYTVMTELPPWSRDMRYLGDLPRLIENFGGWSVCMSEEAVDAWQPYLNGQGVHPDEQWFRRPTRKNGRPNKQELALRDFDRTFPEGLDQPWKNVPSAIKATTGNDYGESTIRRALRSRDED